MNARRTRIPARLIPPFPPGAALTPARPGGGGTPPPGAEGAGEGADGAVGPDGVAPPGGKGIPDFDSILPARLRVHPLTRLSREARADSPQDPNPVWQIALHAELRDSFGQVVKGLGRLRVELYRPTSSTSGGPESQDSVWNVDLRDPGENAKVFDDLVTRTYTVYLASLPAWLEEWAERGEPAGGSGGDAGESGAGARGADDWVTLKAYFIFVDTHGRQHILQTSFRLRR